MATSVDNVKELRERTGAGILDCKAALQDSSGDIEKAIDFLRKKGMASAAKRAGREAKEGLVVSQIRGNKAVMVETNCETDFVARTADFSALAAMAVEETFLKGDSASTSSEKLTQRVAELSGKIGEKILVRRTKLVETAKGVFFTYIHSNNKLGVILELAAAKPESVKSPVFQELGKNLAMQVAASNPLCLVRAEVPAASLEREKAIFREEVKGKPENIVEKIIQGKLEKFYQANCLVEQPFIKEDKKSVKALVEETAKKINDVIEIRRFVRFQLGEALGS
jgi:elongation factor Ts